MNKCILGLAVALALSSQAHAGFSEIKGKASGFYEYSYDHLEELLADARRDARKRCPAWMPLEGPIRHSVRVHKWVPYYGAHYVMEADFLCGQSDY